MGHLQIARSMPQPTPLAPLTVSGWDQLSDTQRAEAQQCAALIQPALERVLAGCAIRPAAEWLFSRRNQPKPSISTLMRWLEQARSGGVVALAPQYKGRIRQTYAWDVRAQHLYNTQANREMSTVAYKLRAEGHADATDSRVRAYLKSLPSQLGKFSPARVGPHEHKLSFGRYLPRHTDNLPVGLIYQGDGHKCDAYVADPGTGNPIRLELVAWIDIASRKIVGWWWCEDESSVNTLCSISNALVWQDHAVGALHTDNGAFRARMMRDDVAGFYVRFGIKLILAIPGNPHGKGHIERWFGTYEERFGKDWDTYCGPDSAPEHNRRMMIQVRAGKRRLPTVEEYIAAGNAWINQYNDDPHGQLQGRSPNDAWNAGIDAERTPLVDSASAVVRPRVIRRAKNLMVKLDGRWYRHAELASYNPAEVLIEYDLMDDAKIKVMDLDGRWICDAKLQDRAPYLSDSRIADIKQTREREALKRLERHADERRRRAASTLVYEPTPNADDSRLLEHAFGSDASASRLPVPDERMDEWDGFSLPSPPDATPEADDAEARYARALAVARAVADGSADPADAAWLERYQWTAEYRGQKQFYEAFEAPSDNT